MTNQQGTLYLSFLCILSLKSLCIRSDHCRKIPLQSHRGDARRCAEAWAAGSGLQPPAGAAPWHSPDCSPPAPANTRTHVPVLVLPQQQTVHFCACPFTAYTLVSIALPIKDAALTGQSCRSCHLLFSIYVASHRSTSQNHNIHIHATWQDVTSVTYRCSLASMKGTDCTSGSWSV